MTISAPFLYVLIALNVLAVRGPLFSFVYNIVLAVRYVAKQVWRFLKWSHRIYRHYRSLRRYRPRETPKEVAALERRLGHFFNLFVGGTCVAVIALSLWT